ncbi:MAG: hypothetical protein QNJ58_11470 [Desulfobacterales bacterium]|nr:hypothetical protein [Desulfobacterales bacterium]
MNWYYLTDESEKSLAPFFSKRILEAVMAGVAIVSAILTILWPRRPFSEIITAENEPIIFFVVFSATLIVNSYINLCCGGGDMIRKGYHIINYQADKPTYEKEIRFYRYGLVQFVLHTILLYMPFLPLLAMAVFNTAVPGVTIFMAACVLFTSSMFCRLTGFLIYLWRGRSSTFGYFVARFLMILFVFVTILPAPVINPLRILYLLNHHPIDSGHAFAIYMAFVSSVIIVLILWNNALVRRYRNKEGLEVQE